MVQHQSSYLSTLLVLQYGSRENCEAAHKVFVIFMFLQLCTCCKNLSCNNSRSPCLLRKSKEKMSEGLAEPVLDDKNPSFPDDPNKCQYQAEIQRSSFI